MENYYARFLLAFSMALMNQIRRRNHESGKPLNSLCEECKKEREAITKQMPEKPPFPLLMLSCALRRRISSLFAEFSYTMITKDLVGRFFLQFCCQLPIDLLSLFGSV